MNDLKNTVIEIAKNSSPNMRTKESGVTPEKIADCAIQTYEIIKAGIEDGRLAGYGKSHADDAQTSQIIVEGFDHYLSEMAGMFGVHYALRKDDKNQIVSAICEALGQSPTYPVYPGDDDGVKPEVWADDDPRWATVDS